MKPEFAHEFVSVISIYSTPPASARTSSAKLHGLEPGPRERWTGEESKHPSNAFDFENGSVIGNPQDAE